ncbi:MAG: hypothetical protein HW388_844 [Dehalococcoidia bacterium]|nr:hypothetical protein [Dehalococcoidia bacterium]
MTVVQQLYDLLEVDEGIERCKQAVASVESALMDNRLLLQSQQMVEEARLTLKRQEVERRDLELTVESSQGKAALVQEKLYGGRVRNPKELENLQAELNILRGQQREQEGELLQLLEAIEGTQESLGNLENTLKEVETTWRREHDRLLVERERLRGDLALLEERRQRLSSLVSPGPLGLYNTLRSARLGLAVVKVERGICQGCRITLPTRVVQMARTSPTPVQCPSCSRILYIS